MTPRRRLWARILASLGVMLFALFVPYRSAVSPRWSIQVVEADGKPVPDFPVNLNWSYFGIDLAPKIEAGRTDSQGRLEFQQKTTWASLAARVLNFERSAKPGPSVWIEACDDHSLMGEFFWEGGRFAVGPSSTQNVRVVVKPSKHCAFT